VLRLQLGYGEEFSVSNEVGTIYDPDLDDNLSKKISDLGIKHDSFITVVDEDDYNPRVNLELLVINERPAVHPTKPISLHADPEIPRKPKALLTNEATNGEVNGVMVQPNGVVGKRKRTADEAELENGEQPSKRPAKMPEANGYDGPHLIVLDDDSGAILIDDD